MKRSRPPGGFVGGRGGGRNRLLGGNRIVGVGDWHRKLGNRPFCAGAAGFVGLLLLSGSLFLSFGCPFSFLLLLLPYARALGIIST